MKITERKIRRLIRHALLNEINCNDPANRNSLECAKQRGPYVKNPGSRDWGVGSDGRFKFGSEMPTKSQIDAFPELQNYFKNKEVEEFLDKSVEEHLESLLTGTVALIKDTLMTPLEAQAKLQGALLGLMNKPDDPSAGRDFKSALGNFAEQGILYALPAGFIGKTASRSNKINALARRKRRGSITPGKGAVSGAIISGLDAAQKKVKKIIKSDREYHVHSTRHSNIPGVESQGLALRPRSSNVSPEKSFKDRAFRATTHTTEGQPGKFSGLSTEEIADRAFYGAQGRASKYKTGLFSSNAQIGKAGDNAFDTIIFELPPGKKLNDIVKPFKGEVAGVRSKASWGEFVAVIPPQYIKAIIDRSGDEMVLRILK